MAFNTYGPSRWPGKRNYMNKRVIIFGNGKLSTKFLRLIKPGDYIVGVDRAAYWLLQQGRTPDVAIGDFDSTTQKEFTILQKKVKHVKKFSSEKDWTDMELAIVHAIKQKPAEVVIAGGIGSRLDHSIATWHLLGALLAAQIPHTLVNETNRVRLVGRGRTMLQRGEHKYVSILSFTNFISLKLSGFRYEVPKTKLIRGTTRGVSNEIVKGQAVIEIFAGKAWVIESND